VAVTEFSDDGKSIKDKCTFCVSGETCAPATSENASAGSTCHRKSRFWWKQCETWRQRIKV